MTRFVAFHLFGISLLVVTRTESRRVRDRLLVGLPNQSFGIWPTRRTVVRQATAGSPASLTYPVICTDYLGNASRWESRA